MAETYATKAFARWTLADAQQAVRDTVAAQVGSQEAYEANRLLVERGDHYREGAIVPTMDDGALRQRRVERLRREQAPNDVVNEVVDNDVYGVCGTEAAVTFVPLEPVPPLADDADEAAKQAHRDAVAAQEAEQSAMADALNAAWDRAGFWDVARDGLRYAEWARRAVYRVWLPVSALVQDAPPENPPEGYVPPPPRLPTDLAFGEALSKCAVSAPEPNTALRYRQPDTQRECSIFLYQRADDGGTARDAAELWYVDDAGETVRRVVTTGTAEGASEVEAAPLPLGGRLPLAEAVLPRLVVTEAMRHQQDALDFDGINGRVATRAAAFRQRATTNAQPLIESSRTPPVDKPVLRKQVDENGITWYDFEAGSIPLGPEEVLHLTGEVVEDETTDVQGNKVRRRTMMTPGLHSEDPVDTERFTHMWTERRAIILRMGGQGHLVGDGRAQLSGAAYVQARARFAMKLRNHAGAFDRGVRDLLTAWIALATLMTDPNDPLYGFLDRYRVQVTARVDAGPLTPEERAQYMTEWKEGAVDWETTAARLGIEDTRAVRTALDRDPMARLALVERVSQVMSTIASAPGGSADAALRSVEAAGLPDDVVAIARAWQPVDTDDVVDDEPPVREVAA